MTESYADPVMSEAQFFHVINRTVHTKIYKEFLQAVDKRNSSTEYDPAIGNSGLGGIQKWESAL